MTAIPPTFPTPGQIRVHQIKQRVLPLLQAGQFELTLSLLEDVLPLDRRDPELHKMLGSCYSAMEQTDKALVHLRRAAELGLRDPETLLMLAGVYSNTGDLAASLRVVDRILQESPDEPRATQFKARLRRSMGDAKGALAIIESTLAKGVRHPHLSILRSELLRRAKRLDEAAAEIEAVLADPATRPNDRRDAFFELGHIRDAMGEYDAAFEAFSRGNGMLDETPIIPIDEFRRVWSREAIDPIPSLAPPKEGPVFIVGMPRSGTTLTEQILAAHPRVASLGESNALNLMLSGKPPEAFHDERAIRAVAEGYATRTASPRTAGAARVVDKMPENYFYLPLISRALPGAKIIHCTRDARDTCLSCFFQNFGPRVTWSRRIETCARQFVFYRQVMDHWQETLGVEILENNYESLTSEPRPGVERMLAHVALPFDAACMAHHKQKATVQTASVDQVRKPIYTTSQQRWKNYEKHLGPMLEILEGF